MGCWHMEPFMAEPRHAAAAAVGSRMLYICGGHNGQRALSSAERFDLTLNRWEELIPMAQRREGAGAAVIAGTLFVCGGLDGRRYALGCAERYDTDKDAWVKVEAMAMRR